MYNINHNSVYANSENAYFTKKEALERIKETLENGYDDYYCDLHLNVFNLDYYIIGTYKARKALEEYDVFKAIGTIYTYEKETFGEVYNKFDDPEKVANMLWYIIGYEAINEICEHCTIISDLWNEQATDENNDKIIATINNLLTN